MAKYNTWTSRLETKRMKNRKIVGTIRKWTNRGHSDSLDYYELFDSDGNFVARDINYNTLHRVLYSM